MKECYILADDPRLEGESIDRMFVTGGVEYPITELYEAIELTKEEAEGEHGVQAINKAVAEIKRQIEEIGEQYIIGWITPITMHTDEDEGIFQIMVYASIVALPLDFVEG